MDEAFNGMVRILVENREDVSFIRFVLIFVIGLWIATHLLPKPWRKVLRRLPRPLRRLLWLGKLPQAQLSVIGWGAILSGVALTMLGAGQFGAQMFHADVEGEWHSGWGILRLSSSDPPHLAKVQGSFDQGEGRQSNIVFGSFEPGTGTLEYTYDMPWKKLKVIGEAGFQLSPDGKMLSGKWFQSDSSGRGNWTLLR